MGVEHSVSCARGTSSGPPHVCRTRILSPPPPAKRPRGRERLSVRSLRAWPRLCTGCVWANRDSQFLPWGAFRLDDGESEPKIEGSRGGSQRCCVGDAEGGSGRWGTRAELGGASQEQWASSGGGARPQPAGPVVKPPPPGPPPAPQPERRGLRAGAMAAEGVAGRHPPAWAQAAPGRPRRRLRPAARPSERASVLLFPEHGDEFPSLRSSDALGFCWPE